MCFKIMYLKLHFCALNKCSKTAPNDHIWALKDNILTESAANWHSLCPH